jgi:hypothetical protein
MSSFHRRFIFIEQGVGAAIFNFVLNAAIAWAMFRGLAQVPLWGQESIGADTLGTSFILPFLTCLAVTRLARKRVQKGHLSRLEWTRDSHPMLGYLPETTVKRALVLGLAGLVLFAPPTMAAFYALGVSDLALRDFIVFKASFAAVEAAIVTPLVALWALEGGTDEPGLAARAVG